jgi:hypothetical protein
LLVRVVGIGVDQRDGHGLDALAAQASQACTQRRLVKRADDRAARVHAFVGLDRQFQRRQQRPLVVDHPAAQAPRHEGTRHLQHLPVALGGDEADARALAFQYGVRRDRRAVHHMGDALRVDGVALAQAGNAVEHADGRIGWRGRHLARIGFARRLIDREQVGEGAPTSTPAGRQALDA